MRTLTGLCMAILLWGVSFHANAAPICPEGSVDGQCVNAGLAATARLGAVIRTEARLSISAHNYPSTDNWRYAYPNALAGAPPFNSVRFPDGGLFSVPYFVYGIRN